MIKIIGTSVKKFFFLSTFLLLISFFVNNAFASNNNTIECIGNYSGSSFYDLVVPKGQTCQLDRFNVVNGSIKVEKNASLTICPDNEIHGDIKAHNADSIYISDLTGGPCSTAKARGITIDGDVKIESANSVSLFGNPYGGIAIIKGSIKVENVALVMIQSFNNFSSIKGDVKVEHSGDVTITENVIGGGLKIKATTRSCIEQKNTVSGKLNSCP